MFFVGDRDTLEKVCGLALWTILVLFVLVGFGVVLFGLISISLLCCFAV